VTAEIILNLEDHLARCQPIKLYHLLKVGQHLK